MERATGFPFGTGLAQLDHRPGDERVPWAAASAVRCPVEARQAKHRAIRAFRTQLEPLGPAGADRPVLPEAVLAHHLRPFEVVFG